MECLVDLRNRLTYAIGWWYLCFYHNDFSVYPTFSIKNDVALPKAELNEGFGLDDSIESIMRDPIHICG